MKKISKVALLLAIPALIVFLSTDRLFSQAHNHPPGTTCSAEEASAAPQTSAAPADADSHAGHDHAKEAPAAVDPHAGHDHAKEAPAAVDPHAGHDHAAHASAGSMPIEELMSQKCEHQVSTIDCDECRYELGAVKITAQVEKMVKTRSMSQASHKQEIAFRGELEYDNQLFRTVTSLVPGVITSMPVRKGELVEAGQVIAMIESRELSHLALELQKQVAELELADKKLAREEMLNEKKVGALQAVQEARASRDLKALEIKCSREQLMLFSLTAKEVDAIAAGRANPAQKGRLPIVSPIKGRVVTIHTNIGSAVNEQQALADIVNISDLRATGQIKEADMPVVISELNRGPLTGYITTQAFPGNLFQAKAVSADAGLKSTTRMLEIQLAVKNPDELLRPGMFIEGILEVGDQGDKASLPSSAVLEDEGVHFVFVRKGPMFFRRDVKLAGQQGDTIFIASGISAGDEIVVEGSFLLKSDILRGKMGAGCAH
ncbi:MAG TPA: efflux RND transporter periplasmic adaptor subunit [Candidatus Rifleibacterium sp.]|nr:efflux RND transporter periplasmic adaptor subunit [Candidatus Rifleibacterium sp.]